MTIAGGATLALAALAAVRGVDSLYTGKYAREARMQQLLRELPMLRSKALANVKTKLKLEPKKPGRIEIVIEDALPLEPATLAPMKGSPFTTETKADEPGAPVVVTLRAEFLMNGCNDLAETLRHELVHAVMRERMDAAAYRALPKWAREGVAVWAADQGPRKLEHALTDPAYSAETAFPGLSQGEHGLDRYAEYFLAFDLLERRQGQGSVAKLVQRLVDGEACADAVRAIAGMSMDEFAEAARTDARAVAARAEPAGAKDLRAFASADRQRKYALVRGAARTFEQLHPDSPCLANVLYLRGKAERLTDDPAAAIDTLERLIQKHLARTHFFDEAWYQLGSAQLAAKKPKAAAEAFRTILRDFPDTSLQEKATLRLVQALAESDRKAEAIEWLDRFDRSFPDSASADEAETLRARLATK